MRLRSHGLLWLLSPCHVKATRRISCLCTLCLLHEIVFILSISFPFSGSGRVRHFSFSCGIQLNFNFNSQPHNSLLHCNWVTTWCSHELVLFPQLLEGIAGRGSCFTEFIHIHMYTSATVHIVKVKNVKEFSGVLMLFLYDSRALKY